MGRSEEWMARRGGMGWGGEGNGWQGEEEWDGEERRNGMGRRGEWDGEERGNGTGRRGKNQMGWEEGDRASTVGADPGFQKRGDC